MYWFPAMIDDRSSSKCCLQDVISRVVDLTCSNAWKSRDFPKPVSKINGNVVFFFQISSKPSLIPVKLFGKWNRFVKTVNAILWRNLAVLKCSYHLPKAWTDRFAHVNDKQPKLYVRSMVQRNSGFPALVHTSQSRMRKKDTHVSVSCRMSVNRSLLKLLVAFNEYKQWVIKLTTYTHWRQPERLCCSCLQVCVHLACDYVLNTSSPNSLSCSFRTFTTRA